MPVSTRGVRLPGPAPRYPCRVCNTEVTSRHHALQCETCQRWQHRKCDTGVSLEEYRNGINNGIIWVCKQCDDGIQILELSFTAEDVSQDVSEVLQMTEDPLDELSTEFQPPAESTLLDAVIDEPAEGNQMEDNESSLGAGAVHQSDLEASQLVEEPSSDEAEDEPALLNVTFDIPQPIIEESLPNLEAHLDMERDNLVRYQLENSGSQRGKPILVDSMGFSYVKRKECRGKVYWRCSVRGRSLTCKATVIQHGEEMVRGCMQHCHEGRPGLLQAVQVREEVRTTALTHVYRPAAAIVEEVVVRSTEGNAGPSSLPRLDQLVRTANRVRQGMRPDEPRDLQFELQDDLIPEGFLLDDVRVRDERHLIFATPEQRELLGRAKSWYIDGTFRVVREPFYQLLTIHAFVKQDGATKQVPLLFALMSRRRRRDYVALFEAVVAAVPTHRVREVTMDFELALWQGFQRVFPQVNQKGCSFHLKQAMWRKAQAIGLQRGYLEDRNVNQLMKEAMALQYLPAEHIPAMFEALRTRANTPMLNEFFLYIETQWMNGPFQLAQWSVFGKAVRTNNDVEGWHHRINSRMGQRLGVYRLAAEMHKEARFVTLQVRLLTERRLVRVQRKAYRTSQARLFKLWEEYPVQRSAASLLRGCAAIFGNVGE